MLVPNSKLLNLPVLSVQDSGKIATISNTIVDPDSLKIIAFRIPINTRLCKVNGRICFDIN